MSTLNVKIPDEMEAELETFLDENPYYLNRSELVRDALRHLLEAPSSRSAHWRTTAFPARRLRLAVLRPSTNCRWRPSASPTGVESG